MNIGERTAGAKPRSQAGISYTLNPEALDEMEAELVVSLLGIESTRSPLVAVISSFDSPMSNFVRTLECQAFPGYDFGLAMKPYEEHSRFILTVDLEARAVAHCKRVVTAVPGFKPGRTGRTGIEIVDDRLSASKPEESLDLESIISHHRITDLSELLNVTTNFATRRIERTGEEPPYTLVSYKAVFELTRVFGNHFVVAYLNGLARTSLGRLGVEWELLAGKPYHLPDPESDSYDLEYEAVVIPESPHNVELFNALAAWKVPMYWMAANGQLTLS